LMQATGMVNDHLVSCPRRSKLGPTRGTPEIVERR